MLEYSALEAMAKGRGTLHGWRDLVDVLILSEMMGKGGVGTVSFTHMKPATNRDATLSDKRMDQKKS